MEDITPEFPQVWVPNPGGWAVPLTVAPRNERQQAIVAAADKTDLELLKLETLIGEYPMRQLKQALRKERELREAPILF